MKTDNYKKSGVYMIETELSTVKIVQKPKITFTFGKKNVKK